MNDDKQKRMAIAILENAIRTIRHGSITDLSFAVDTPIDKINTGEVLRSFHTGQWFINVSFVDQNLRNESIKAAFNADKPQ